MQLLNYVHNTSAGHRIEIGLRASIPPPPINTWILEHITSHITIRTIRLLILQHEANKGTHSILINKIILSRRIGCCLRCLRLGNSYPNIRRCRITNI